MPPKKKPRRHYRALCLAEYGLQPPPWPMSPAVAQASTGTEEQWAEYSRKRAAHSQYCVAAPAREARQDKCDMDAEEEEEEEEEEGSDYDSEEGGGIWRKVRAKMLKLLTQHTLYNPNFGWDRHVYVLPDGDGSMYGAETECIVYSPLALPRAICLKMRYHHRSRYRSTEFFFSVGFKLWAPGGVLEPTQAKLAEQCPKDFYPQDGVFDSEEGFEVLCSNHYDDPPSDGLNLDFEEDDTWVEVENIGTKNYTAATVRRIRAWLFGNTARQGSHTLVDDLALMRLLLAAAGTECVDVGYCWSPPRSLQNVLEADGVASELEGQLDPDSPNYSTTWLEYHTRLVTQSLTVLDTYYQPYDPSVDHAHWGKKVLWHVARLLKKPKGQGCASKEGRQHKKAKEDEDEEEDEVEEDEEEEEGEEEEDEEGLFIDSEGEDEYQCLQQSPHLVWQYAQRGILPWAHRHGSPLMNFF